MNRLKFSLLFVLVAVFVLDAQNTTFKISTWNTEWLTCSTNGPTDENLQMTNVVKVIKAMNSDVVALQEVGTSNAYSTVDTIVKRLGSEWAGSMISWSADNCSQNQGIVYKKSKVQLVSASLMTSAGSSYNWSSGRFPALYNLNLVAGSSIIPVALVNIHAKAMSDETSYARRKAASESLKSLLDGNSYNAKNVILLGDFNDYLTGTQCSNCSPAESPYKNFVTDTDNYKCLTGSLYDPNYNSPVIDNIIISNELISAYSNNTFRETTAAQTVSSFTSTTSDHYPISAEFIFSGGGGQAGCEDFNFTETFSESLGNFTGYSAIGTQTWGWRLNYGAVVSGYQNLVSNPNEDWLISPALDLSGKSNATLNFEHAINYAGTETDKLLNHTLWITDSYNQLQPASGVWTPLSISTMPAGNNWTYVNSGIINIPSNMMKSNVRIAFKYQSSSTVASTWEIKNLNVNGKCINTQLNNDLNSKNSRVYISGRTIKIENDTEMPVTIYDITGRILYSAAKLRNAEFTMSKQGVYIVRNGNKTYKVAN